MMNIQLKKIRLIFSWLLNIISNLLSLLICQLALASTLNVPTIEYPTIKRALVAANSGDTILVQPGTYHETGLSFNGRSIRLRSVEGPSTTIIDGDNNGIIFTITQGESRATIIEGFTIINGYGITSGGFFIRDSSPLIQGNIFKSNKSQKGGGAIQIYSSLTTNLSNPLIQENIFNNNIATIDGGAIHIQSASADIIRNKFYNNRADGDPASSHGAGGAIVATESTNIKIFENIFERNIATFAGGAISAFASDISIIGNIIRNNNGGLFAGGIHLETQQAFGGKVYLVKNNRIEDNVATDKGGGIHTYMENTQSIINISNNFILNNNVIDSNCTSTYLSCGLGGGIGHFGGIGTLLVKDNIINGNKADLYGAAIFTGISVTLNGNTIKNNKAIKSYPGVVIDSANEATITSNKFILNSLEAGFEANAINIGAIRVTKWKTGSAIIEGNLFQENQGVQSGSLMVDGGPLDSSAKIINNTFINNKTTLSSGGSIWLQYSGDVINNIFFGDYNGIRVKRITGENLGLRLNNNNFINNSSALVLDPPSTYTTVSSLNGTSYSTKNLSLNPYFEDQKNQEYHLLNTSPLLNKANCTESIFGVDFDKEFRPQASGCDIGADEYSILSHISAGLINRNTATFYLRNSNSPGIADLSFRYGSANSGWLPLAGDWDGDGIDTIGFYRPDTATFYLRNSNSPGIADLSFRYGSANSGWLPLAGDWDGDGIDTIGFYRPDTATFYLRNSNSPGIADLSFRYGSANSGWLPLAGDWDGLR